MQTVQTFHRAPVHKPGKLVSVALVGSLHIAVIYTLLVALDIVPNPVKPAPPISIRMLSQTKTENPPPASFPGVAMARPTTPSAVPPPIHIASLPSQPAGIAPDTGSVAPAQIPTGIDLGARPIGATHTVPPYPPLAVRLGYEGTVRLRISVDEHGNVFSADVLGSSGHADLDQAAVNWVETHWRYEPAIRDGKAVKATTDAVVTFKLDQRRG